LSDLIFIFFAGIAIATGLSYLWLGITERNYRSNLFFGLFAISAGVYFILSSSHLENFSVALFFATTMFLLFPWYFAYARSLRLCPGIHKTNNYLYMVLGFRYSFALFIPNQ